jgi:hypothetical protein
MPRNSRIPGVAEVPMPPASSPMGKALKGVTDALTALVTPDPASEPTKAKAVRRPRGSAPKPVRLEPNFGKSGIRIFVGESKIPVATITQETLDEAFNDYGFGPKGYKELRGLRDGLLDCMPKDFHPEITGDVTRIATWVGDLEGKLAVAQSNLEEARSQRGEWERAAGRNLRDFRASEAKVAKLNTQLDRIAADLDLCEQARTDEATAFAAELHRAKGLGWLMAGVAVLLLIGSFIVQTPPMSMRGAR